MFLKEGCWRLKVSWGRPLASAVVSVVLGVTITLAVAWVAYHTERRSLRSNFESLAYDRFQGISSTFEQFTRLVSFADNVFLVAPRADSPAFPDYVRSLRDFLKRDQATYPTIDAIAWVPRVSPDELPAYQRAAQAVIDPRFEIDRGTANAQGQPSSQRDALFPSYVSVGTPSRPLHPGENMALDPAAWKAMTRACDSGQIVAMAPIEDSVGTHSDFGYRVFQPLYRGGDPGNIAARRQANDGFLCLDLDGGYLVGRALEHLKPMGIDVWVVDQNGGKDNVLCRHISRWGSSGADNSDWRSPNQLVAHSAMPLFGRDVSIYCVASPLFEAKHAIWQPWALLCLGLALTVAATAYRYNRAVHAVVIDQAMNARMDSLRHEMEQREEKRKQPKPLPPQSPGDGPRESVIGAPLAARQPQSSSGEYDTSLTG